MQSQSEPFRIHMITLEFYFDPISPYAYLAFEQLPKALMGVSHQLIYKPILFAGLLKHYGQLGPAEIAPKRAWTYRQVQWLAHCQGTRLDLPASHPFNPLPLLRLAIAASAPIAGAGPNRFVCEQIFQHVWQGGLDAADPDRLKALTAQLKPELDPASELVKNRLKDQTQEAIERGIFGVPTLCFEDKQFWGLDALPMLRAAIDRDPWFESAAWNSADQRPEQQRAQVKPL
jgi:2-hydroxychromene-2-carboxylate isomerase